MSTDDGELGYLTELENAYNERDRGVGLSPESAIRSSDGTGDVQVEVYAPYWMELENAYNE